MPSPTDEINRLRHGRPDPPAPVRMLRAGPLTLTFEDITGWVRQVRLREREVIRAIYGAVRGAAWETITPCLSNLVVEEAGPDAFRLTFDAECRQGNVDFVWRGTLTSAADGTLVYAFDGEARSAFSRNRIGLCVLHPDRECAGRPIVIEHTDGSIEKSAFPERIAPHQPFFDIRAIRHFVVPGTVEAEVRFDGEVFETEDQRNWTDGSFKTYGTPLALPFPIEVAAGTRVHQQVTLTLRGTLPSPTSRLPGARGETLLDRDDAPPRPLPTVGLMLPGPDNAAAATNARLRALNPAHLRVDVDLRLDTNLRAPGNDTALFLKTAIAQASTLGVPLEVGLKLPEDFSEVEDRLGALGRFFAGRPAVARWLLICGQAEPWRANWLSFVRPYLEHYALGAKVLAGTNANFAELNRERPDRELPLDGVFFALNPQVHAFDDLSLMENLAPQAEAVRNARAFVGDGLLAVSPVTLTPRGGANGFPGPEADPRLGSLLAAAWTLGSIRYLTEAGTDSVTYFATRGSHGVLSASGVLPLYHVLADVNEFAGGQAVALETSDRLAAVGLVLLKKGSRRTLVANLAPAPQQVRVPAGGDTRLTRLDETNARLAMNEPEGFRDAPGERVTAVDGFVTLDLLPYAVARMDREEK